MEPTRTGEGSTHKRLVLVGGGHAHVEVLRRWREDPLPDVAATLVVDHPKAVYSGMVPGFVAGDYRREEIEIDVASLARLAGIRVVEAAATAIEPRSRRIVVADGTVIDYDVASLDVGSTIRGLDLPGVGELTLATRPIGDFVSRLEAAVATARARETSTLRVAVVGGGTAGFELAFTLLSRLRRTADPVDVIVVSENQQGVGTYPPRVSRRILLEAQRRGITVVHGRRALAVDPEGVQLDDSRIDADLVVWATGAAPLPFLAAAGTLPLDQRGFVRVTSSLQVVGHANLFAVGDCASMDAAPWVTKAGVYAVRQGPVLDANLRASLQGGTLGEYRPQRDFLSLINFGEGRAAAAKWGMVVVGRLAWSLKNHIDRAFVERYR